jgi:uncharacterized protein (DUF1697 family)
MKTYIAFIRGVNVGGKSLLPMKTLVALLENLGLQNVKTYLQSGNAIFQSQEKEAPVLSRKISAEIKKSRGFEPGVLLLELAQLEKAAKSNPFPEAVSEPKTLHLNFLASLPLNPDLEALNSLKSKSERFLFKGDIFYLHAPAGIGRSKLAANAERLLGVPMTGRNWRTISEIIAKAKTYR